MIDEKLIENSSGSMQDVFKIIKAKQPAGMTKDSPQFCQHSLSEIDEIKRLQYDHVKASMIMDSVKFQSYEEMQISEKKRYKDSFQKLTKDGFYNPVSGIGTSDDPATSDSSFIPVSLSPWEATSLYASGGITKIICDKKSKALILNGFTFKGDISPDDIKKLTDYAMQIGFDRALSSGIREGVVFGGGVVVPYFKNDTPISLTQSLDELMNAGILDQNCIDYFITVDRWNCVVVPDYNITAKDYLFPKNVYLPLGGMNVKTDRCALIRPNPLPFWGAIRQLGWGVSDMESYIRSIYAYNIMIQSLPIMFQQMSLLFQTIPMDSTLAMNGSDAMKDFIKENEEKMREWSMLNPRAINSYGDIKTVTRTYAGMSEMIDKMCEKISADCGFPKSVIFHMLTTGFSDNKEDVTLKQSETIKMISSEVVHNVRQLVKILVISCFGKNSEQANANIDIDFNAPVVQSDTEKADAGLKYAQSINTLVQAGMPLDLAIKTTSKFFPDYEIDQEDMERITTPSETEQQPQNKLGQGAPQLQGIFT